MSKYDGLDYYKDATPEQRLSILAIETIPLLESLELYGKLIKRLLDQELSDKVISEIRDCAEKIIIVKTDLKELREKIIINRP